MDRRKMVIIFVAPPGAGKGTQGDLMAEKFGFYHLESSKMFEGKLFRKELDNDPEIIKLREDWRTGKLISPAWIAKIAVETIKELHSEGKSIVFSGSFRTLPEAELEIPLVEELYGRANIKVFNITLSEAESVKRNSNRRICEKNRHPIPNFPEFENVTVCPQDGSPLIKRSDLDQPEIIKKRYQVYLEETEPVLNYLKDRDYKIIEINGEQPIEKVSQDILVHFNHDIH